MGFLFRGFFQVVLLAMVVTIIGGYALANSLMSTGGAAFGAGLKGGGTFLSATGQGFRDAAAYENAQSQAQANQAIREQAAKDQARKDAQKKAQGK